MDKKKMSIKVSFELTNDDFIAGQLNYMDYSEYGKKAKITATMIGVTMPALLLREAYLFFEELRLLIIGIPVLFLGVFIAPRFIRKRHIAHLKEMLEEGDNSSMFGNHEVVFETDMLKIKNPGGKQEVKWSVINKVEENENYIFIFQTAVSFYIIPKREMVNKNEIIELIKSKLKGAQYQIRLS